MRGRYLLTCTPTSGRGIFVRGGILVALRPQALARIAVLVALSGAGAFVKFPSPVGTVAMDAAPGYLAAFALGPTAGALVAAVGHLFSALLTGFPLTVPFHLLVALAMAAAGGSAGWLRRRAGPVAGVVGAVLVNGFLAPWLLAFVPNPLGRGLFLALLLPLVVAALANAVVAAAAERLLARTRILS